MQGNRIDGWCACTKKEKDRRTEEGGLREKPEKTRGSDPLPSRKREDGVSTSFQKGAFGGRKVTG